MNFSTFIVLVPIVVLVILSVRYLAKGGINSCAGCSANGSCSGNSSSCKWTKDIEKARVDLAKEREAN